ncbi:hypothetical protein NCGM2_3316 [Pseudomonas aeruginosa NCGM2.S1]|nr:hypothetical protein NCGM2_3316 [Pseudomonas aeruginosa NCGM2.S1]
MVKYAARRRGRGSLRTACKRPIWEGPVGAAGRRRPGRRPGRAPGARDGRRCAAIRCTGDRAEPGRRCRPPPAPGPASRGCLPLAAPPAPGPRSARPGRRAPGPRRRAAAGHRRVLPPAARYVRRTTPAPGRRNVAARAPAARAP